MKRLVRYLFLAINFVLACLLVICYWVPEIDPIKMWWPTLFGLVYPYLLILNFCFVIVWGFLYWRYLFLSLICIFAGYSVHIKYFRFLPELHTLDEGIQVLSFNVRNFYSYLENNNEETDVLDFIASQNANIICLQETKLQKTGVLNPLKLKAHFPGITHCQLAHQSKWNGPVTFTSYPIVNMGEIRFDATSNMVIYTDVLKDQDTLRVYNCHLQSYGIRPEDYSMIDSLSLGNVKYKEIKQIGLKLRDANKQRSDQIIKLKNNIDSCVYPIIVCGDFNDTPISYTYSQMRLILNDAFVEAGCGISTTYRGKLPPYRIDYIFYSDKFKAFNYKRHRVVYSDHYPVSALLCPVE